MNYDCLAILTKTMFMSDTGNVANGNVDTTKMRNKNG